MQDQRRPPKALNFSRIIGTSWKLTKNNILLWILLSVVVNFFSWKLVTELGPDLNKYTVFVFGKSLEDALDHLAQLIGFSDEGISGESLAAIVLNTITRIVNILGGKWEVIKTASIYLVQLTLLQVFVSQLVHDQLVLRRTKTSLAEIVQRYRTIDFLLDVLRAITIPIFYSVFFWSGYIVILLGQISLFLVPYQFPTLPKYVGVLSVLLGAIGSLIAIVLLPLHSFRLLLAVPVTTIENKRVLESLKRSWRMTVGYRIRFFIVLSMATVLILAGTIVLWLPFIFFYSNDPHFWTVELFAPTLSAIVIAVCYCYLRAAEVGITIHEN